MVESSILDGEIANWREYRYESSKPWEEFTNADPF